MKAVPIKKVTRYGEEFYWCDYCDQYTRDWEVQDVYWHGHEEETTFELNDGRYYFTESCGQTTVGTCDDCNTTVYLDETWAAPSDSWVCSECGKVAETKREGDECCRPYRT